MLTALFLTKDDRSLLGHAVEEQWFSGLMEKRKEVYIDMICVGIDAASEKHDVCITDGDGVVLSSPFRIRNDESSYKLLRDRLRDLREKLGDNEVKLGIESTGSYSETIVSYFSGIEWVDVIYINPLLTRMYQQTRKVHYAKTDKIDAKGIALFLASRPELRTYTPVSNDVRQLREIYRELMSINDELCASKNRLKSLIHRYFPEYLTVFGDVFTSASLWVLDDIDTLEHLGERDPEIYMKRVNRKSGGLITMSKAESVIELAGRSVGLANGYNSYVISSNVRRIRLLQESKASLLAFAEGLIKATHPNILGIPGIGIMSAAGIIGEIGDIGNFASSDALYAFTGLDPRVYESGKYKAANVRISKKGSPYLRNALYIASECVIRFEPTFMEYYAKKASEGKSFRVVLGHVAKKLVRILYAMMKRNLEYAPQTAK